MLILALQTLDCTGASGDLLIQAQVVGRRKEFQAQFHRNVHIRNIFAVAVPIPVVEVLNNLVEYHAAARVSPKVDGGGTEQGTPRLRDQFKCSQTSAGSPPEALGSVVSRHEHV